MNHVNTTVIKYSSGAFIGVVTPLDQELVLLGLVRRVQV